VERCEVLCFLFHPRLLPTEIFLSVVAPLTVVLPVVLYECETWSLTLREKQRLRVFEDRVLRRTFGPKMDEATGE
jgi:hypothetical protein